MPNNCSKIRCPFNASTFKDCSMACECEYYTKQLTNGDMIKALFPKCEIMSMDNTFYYVELDSYFPKPIFKNWWNAPYKEVEDADSD